ncbi:MAG: hypothetical protein HQ527_01080 [Cyanobacteria bacterium]|nr:hypothetical protein [Cyanobacteria bacterium bin.51]
MATIDRWLWPDVLKTQHISVARAKKAIADYKESADQPQSLAEWMVLYCERAAGFCQDLCLEAGSHFDAPVRMFERALKLTVSLPDQLKTDRLLVESRFDS